MRSRASAEQTVRDVRRKTRAQYSAEEKIRMVLSGRRGEDRIAALCRREGIAQSLYYRCSKPARNGFRVTLHARRPRVRSRTCAVRCATSRRCLPNRCWRIDC